MGSKKENDLPEYPRVKSVVDSGKVFDYDKMDEMPPPSWLSARTEPTTTYDAIPDYVHDPSDPYAMRHAEYGYDPLIEHQSVSMSLGALAHPDDEEPPLYVTIRTFLSFAFLIILGRLYDFYDRNFRPERFQKQNLMPRDGFAALYSDFDSFFTRRLKNRLEDCFARPVTGVAGRLTRILNRERNGVLSTDFKYTGETSMTLNVSSYNYLGFAQSRGVCTDEAKRVLNEHGITAGGVRADSGNHNIHLECEKLVARFLGVESVMIISMGFATNSCTIPALVSKGCLILSDQYSHASIRFGVRQSGAMVMGFKHNDMNHLESILREQISQGQPRTHRPWKKILVIVEGLYSMEGTMVKLPQLMELKKKYKFYLFLDEAHSIGAIGPSGRGVTEYFGVSSKDVDIMMGTFTKSFGAAGGYIGGKRELIEHLRVRNHAHLYAEAMPPIVVAQVMTAMGLIMGKASHDIVPKIATLPKRLADGSDGVQRIQRLAFNTRYFHCAMRRLGYIIYGQSESPITPLIIFESGKMGYFSRLMYKKYGIIIVVVSYPATPLTLCRIRFCLSAAHTKDDIDWLIRATDDIGSACGVKISTRAPHESLEHVLATNVEYVRKQEELAGLPPPAATAVSAPESVTHHAAENALDAAQS